MERSLLGFDGADEVAVHALKRGDGRRSKSPIEIEDYNRDTIIPLTKQDLEEVVKVIDTAQGPGAATREIRDIILDRYRRISSSHEAGFRMLTDEYSNVVFGLPADANNE